MKKTLCDMGFLPNVYDPCVFHQVKINMDGYIKNLIVDIEGTSTTPAGVDLFVDDDDTLLAASEQKALHTKVDKLLFLATHVRPDILLVVNYLTPRVNKFTANDDKKCKRCLKYLHKTKELGLVLSVNDLHGASMIIIRHSP
jgi:hypothetical protein